MNLEGVKHFQSLSTKTSKIDRNVPKSLKWLSYHWNHKNGKNILENLLIVQNTLETFMWRLVWDNV